jgi:DNA modification methylase
MSADRVPERTELIWPGKYNADGSRREAEPLGAPLELLEIHNGGAAELTGWTNQLIRGDNLAAMQALHAEFKGRIDLIYIDPPFAAGDERMGTTTIANGDADGPALLEQPAYRDRWAEGVGSYLAMIAPRLDSMRELLADSGSLFVHVDYRLSAHLRLLLDECFGPAAFRNEIIWHYHSGGAARTHYPRKHDAILWYARGPAPFFDPRASSAPRNRCPECGGASEQWNHLKKHIDADGRVYRTIRSAGKVYRYYDDEPALIPDVWLGVNHMQQKDPERTGYPTQKPERLLQRIVAAHSPEGGLVADFFCGSGTALAAAERLGRRWLGCDVGRLAVHTARKRLRGIDGGRPFGLFRCGPEEGRDLGPARVEVELLRDGRGVAAALRGFTASGGPLAEKDRLKIKHWSDLLDYWAVDWEGGAVFAPGWAAWRTRGRAPALASPAHRCDRPGRRRVVVRAADVFGGEAEQTFEIDLA